MIDSLFNKETPTQVFSCEIFEILRTSNLKNICGQLPLYLKKQKLFIDFFEKKYEEMETNLTLPVMQISLETVWFFKTNVGFAFK